MKNRKIVVTAFVLIATLMLGIGYAAFTDTLTIIGNAHIDILQAENAFESNVYFSAAEVLTDQGTGTGTVDDIASCTLDDATYTANKLAVKGEKSVFKFTIKNDSNVDAKVTVNPQKLSGVENPSNSNTEKFTVEYAYSNADMIVPAKGTMDVTVTVTVKDVVLNATSATFGIELTADAINEG